MNDRNRDVTTPVRHPAWSGRARRWLGIVAFVGAVLVGRSSLADHYRVPTGSMRPTVHEGDHVLVNKAAYGLRLPQSHIYLAEFGGPARGDVVVFDSPETGEVLLKRVVAVPGDLVEVRKGRVVLNGETVPVDVAGGGAVEKLDGVRHDLDLSRGGGPDVGPVKVPPGRYLLLGDNRGNSHDGRFFGFVERSAILGRAIGVFLRDGVPTWLPL
ncbi:MAG: signal peptidase I [Deltaproteobacteria bacterium]|nr:signal peptidase I [Deltaproteobacteria bacterium]